MCCFNRFFGNYGCNGRANNGSTLFIYGRIDVMIEPRYNGCNNRCYNNYCNYPVPYMMMPYMKYALTGNGYGVKNMPWGCRTSNYC